MHLTSKQKKYAPYIALVLAVFAAYANSFGNPFLFDDGLIITRNEFLKSWSSFGSLLTASTTGGAHIDGGFYRPIQNILYFFTYQIAGETPFAFHFLNTTLHAANACLLFALGRKLNFNLWATFLAALLWAVHPIHTEAITYMSGTADPLYSMFCLIGLLVLLPDFTRRKIFMASGFFILALLSKETAVMFPLLAISCLYFVSRNRLKLKTYLPLWPLWAVMAVYLLWRLNAPGLDGPQSYSNNYDKHDFYNLKLYAERPLLRIYTFFATLPHYLALLIWPMDLHMERSFKIFASFRIPVVLLGCQMFLLTAAQVIFNRKERWLPFSWGLLWFGIAHAPNTGLLVPVNSLFLEHWMYFPTAGLFLGIAQTLSLLAKNQNFRKAIAVVVMALILLCTVRTWDQNRIWSDPVIFYNHIFKYGEVSPRGRNNLALAYMERRQFAEAISEFQKAIAITDTYAEVRHNLAICYVHLPDPEQHAPQAIKELERALEIDPNFYRSYLALATIYKALGKTQKAEEASKRAEELKKRFEP